MPRRRLLTLYLLLLVYLRILTHIGLMLLLSLCVLLHLLPQIRNFLFILILLAHHTVIHIIIRVPNILLWRWHYTLFLYHTNIALLLLHLWLIKRLRVLIPLQFLSFFQRHLLVWRFLFCTLLPKIRWLLDLYSIVLMHLLSNVGIIFIIGIKKVLFTLLMNSIQNSLMVNRSFLGKLWLGKNL